MQLSHVEEDDDTEFYSMDAVVVSTDEKSRNASGVVLDSVAEEANSPPSRVNEPAQSRTTGALSKAGSADNPKSYSGDVDLPRLPPATGKIAQVSRGIPTTDVGSTADYWG